MSLMNLRIFYSPFYKITCRGEIAQNDIFNRAVLFRTKQPATSLMLGSFLHSSFKSRSLRFLLPPKPTPNFTTPTPGMDLNPMNGSRSWKRLKTISRIGLMEETAALKRSMELSVELVMDILLFEPILNLNFDHKSKWKLFSPLRIHDRIIYA